jgi:NDP-sugar pyrophosphorylase family protein
MFDLVPNNLLAIVLAGGQGTRIRHLLPSTPKPLAMVANQPFLYWICTYLYQSGIRKIVISAGYLSEQVVRFALDFKLSGLEIQVVTEQTPLGTAGGCLNALQNTSFEFTNVFVCNGDSIVLGEVYKTLANFDKYSADALIFGIPMDDTDRFGILEVNNQNLLLKFREKKGGPGLINAGMYLFKRRVLDEFAQKKPLSFEHDLFPSLLDKNAKIEVHSMLNANFIDIGTEKDLLQASRFIKNNLRWFNAV